MLNYLILNGRKSTEINGLLIQSLPPITKPSKRTEIATIDGRDGDTITDLGFAAYDRKVKIGLFGCFDIDEVISYFNSSGTVVFSNEFDKYYRYTIVNQIDFERLIRFRQADVVFHCQPFKYSVMDEPKDIIDHWNFIDVPDYSGYSSGVQYSVGDGVFNFNGTGHTEIYIPITPVTLTAGDYKLTFTVSGGDPAGVYARLINGSPTRSFGGYAHLSEGETVIESTIESPTRYDYLYFEADLDDDDFDLAVDLKYLNTMPIRNLGNYKSKPTIRIEGNGGCVLSLNGMQMFRLDIDEYVEIDTDAMEAYKGEMLVNRTVAGDYERFALNVGLNNITYTGNVSKIIVSNYSRWI